MYDMNWSKLRLGQFAFEKDYPGIRLAHFTHIRSGDPSSLFLRFCHTASPKYEVDSFRISRRVTFPDHEAKQELANELLNLRRLSELHVSVHKLTDTFLVDLLRKQIKHNSMDYTLKSLCLKELTLSVHECTLLSKMIPVAYGLKRVLVGYLSFRSLKSEAQFFSALGSLPIVIVSSGWYSKEIFSSLLHGVRTTAMLNGKSKLIKLGSRNVIGDGNLTAMKRKLIGWFLSQELKYRTWKLFVLSDTCVGSPDEKSILLKENVAETDPKDYCCY